MQTLPKVLIQLNFINFCRKSRETIAFKCKQHTAHSTAERENFSMLSSAVRRKRDGKPKFPEPQLTQPRLQGVTVNVVHDRIQG